jgi:hypothetical protein
MECFVVGKAIVVGGTPSIKAKTKGDMPGFVTDILGIVGSPSEGADARGEGDDSLAIGSPVAVRDSLVVLAVSLDDAGVVLQVENVKVTTPITLQASSMVPSIYEK